MCGLAVLFIIFDSVTKILRLPMVIEPMSKLGQDTALAMPIGIILLVSLFIFMIPRTAFFGALLLTAYFGGAVATNLFYHQPVLVNIMPILMAVFIWSGLYVTNAHLRALVHGRINA